MRKPDWSASTSVTASSSRVTAPPGDGCVSTFLTASYRDIDVRGGEFSRSDVGRISRSPPTRYIGRDESSQHLRVAASRHLGQGRGNPSTAGTVRDPRWQEPRQAPTGPPTASTNSAAQQQANGWRGCRRMHLKTSPAGDGCAVHCALHDPAEDCRAVPLDVRLREEHGAPAGAVRSASLPAYGTPRHAPSTTRPRERATRESARSDRTMVSQADEQERRPGRIRASSPQTSNEVTRLLAAARSQLLTISTIGAREDVVRPIGRCTDSGAKYEACSPHWSLSSPPRRRTRPSRNDERCARHGRCRARSGCRSCGPLAATRRWNGSRSARGSASSP